MKRYLLIAALALLAVGGALWAADNSWLSPVPTLGGFNTGDVLYFADANNLGNSNRIRLGGSGTPTCSTNCANATVTGTDSAGLINIGNLPYANGFRLNFARAWASAPACTAAVQTTTANYVERVQTGTTWATITLAAGPTTSDIFSYICVGAS